MYFIPVAASATGSTHVMTARPCEDSFASRNSIKGDWSTAIICDGCGSAPCAREGAKFISAFLAESLIALADEISSRGPGDWIVDAVVKVLADLREQMRARLGKDISRYAATIVGAMISAEGGFIIHLGDGIGSAFTFGEPERGMGLNLVANSEPKNGEYANETYYITDADWIKNIRITPFLAADCVVLATDGAQPFLFDLNSPSGSRISNLLREIVIQGVQDAATKLEEILESREAAKLSGDDKTVFLLIKREAWANVRNSNRGKFQPDTQNTSLSERTNATQTVFQSDKKKAKADYPLAAWYSPKPRRSDMRRLRMSLPFSFLGGLCVGAGVGYGSSLLLQFPIAYRQADGSKIWTSVNAPQSAPASGECNKEAKFRPTTPRRLPRWCLIDTSR
jgi:hypothetical protein